MTLPILQQLAKAQKAQRRALAELHLHLGFATPEALIRSLTDAVAHTRGNPSAEPLALPPAKRRPQISKAQKAAVIAALKSGTAGTAISAKMDLSYATVHRIKKGIGLVREGQVGRLPSKKLLK